MPESSDNNQYWKLFARNYQIMAYSCDLSLLQAKFQNSKLQVFPFFIVFLTPCLLMFFSALVPCPFIVK